MKKVICLKLNICTDGEYHVSIPDKDYQSQYYDSQFFEYTMLGKNNNTLRLRRVFDFTEQGIKDICNYINHIIDNITSDRDFTHNEVVDILSEMLHYIESIDIDSVSYKIDNNINTYDSNYNYYSNYKYAYFVTGTNYSVDEEQYGFHGYIDIKNCNAKKVKQVIYED